MFKLNPKTGIVKVYQNECAIPTEKGLNNLTKSIYDLAQMYYFHPDWLKKQIIEDWFPWFQRMLGVDDNSLALEDVLIRQQDPREIMHERMANNPRLDEIDYASEFYNKGYKVDRDIKIEVCAKFKVKGFDKSEFVPILHIPYVREDGVIEYNRSEYSFTHMLEQTDGISFNKAVGSKTPPSITLRTNRNTLKIFPGKQGGPVLTIGKQNYELMNVISAMLRKDGYNTQDKLMDVWNDFADNEIVNLRNPKDIDKFNVRWFFSGGSSRRVDAAELTERQAPKLMCLVIDRDESASKMYDTTHLRDTLNDILSLKQAKDKILAKDVEIEGKVWFKAGSVITNDMIDMCQHHGVYILYVRQDVNIEGSVLAEQIILRQIPVGTLVTNEIEEAFPEEDGMYTKVIHTIREGHERGADHLFVLDKGTILTKDHVNLLRSSGIESIKILVLKKVKTINFYTEILSNKQFKGEWIGKETGKWYYLDSTGKYIEQLGTGYTSYDMLALWSYAVKAFRNDNVIRLPNIDEDFRKSLIPINIQFSRALRYATSEGCAQMKQTFAAYWNDKNKITYTQADSPLIEKFFAYEKLFWKYLVTESRCVKPIPASALNNPIAYVSELTKANVFVASKNSISDTQRRIAIGSYGKIDPYECPQSQRIGVVNNLTTSCRISKDGIITTPYYKVKHSGGKSSIDVNQEPVFMSIEEEEKHVIADITSIDISPSGQFMESDNKLILCRVPGQNNKDRQSFEKRPIGSVEYVNTNALQPLSYASATIPFLCNNDAARAVFAVAQMKQAKGLVRPEEPIVMTSAYSLIPRLNNRFCYISKRDEYLYSSYRDPKSQDWRIMTGDCASMLRSGKIAKVVEEASYKQYTSGDNSVMTIDPLISPNEDIMDDTPELHDGDVVVKSNFVSQRGILQFGVNALVLFIPDGYNYEDSVHVSETFANKMESYRINKELLTVKPTTMMPRIVHTKEIPIYTSEPFSPKTSNNRFTIKYKNSAGNSATVSKKLTHAYGQYIGQRSVKRDDRVYIGVEVDLLSHDKLQVGDKISNRHGNKCTVCRKESDADMPQLANGESVEVILNPLGVGSRMNIGQIKEATLGLVGHVLSLQFDADAYNTMTDIELRTWVKFAWDVANNTTHYSKLSDDQRYPADLDTVMNKPEYKSIVDENIKEWVRDHFDITQDWANTFDQNGTFEYEYTIDIGDEITDEEKKTKRKCRGRAMGGFLYMFKLTQESHEKIHARANDMSDEKYAAMSDAPPQGAQRGGGQRMGTMEIDALCAYGVSNYIHELTNERADNAIARENFNCKTYFDRKIVKQYLKESKGQRRAVTQLLYMLLGLGIMTECDNNEFIPLSKDNSEQLSHVNGYYLQRNVGKKFNTKDEDKPSYEDLINTIQLPVEEEEDSKTEEYTSPVEELGGAQEYVPAELDTGGVSMTDVVAELMHKSGNSNTSLKDKFNYE